MFANNSNEVRILLAQEAFDNIVGSKGNIKLQYAADNTKDNTKEDSGGVHNEHDPVAVFETYNYESCSW